LPNAPPILYREARFTPHRIGKAAVGVWCIISKAWLAYQENFLGNETPPYEEKRKLLNALIGISTGYSDVSKYEVPVEVLEGLVQCFKDAAGN
jgi:hypothetical protein